MTDKPKPHWRTLWEAITGPPAPPAPPVAPPDASEPGETTPDAFLTPIRHTPVEAAVPATPPPVAPAVAVESNPEVVMASALQKLREEYDALKADAHRMDPLEMERTKTTLDARIRYLTEKLSREATAVATGPVTAQTPFRQIGDLPSVVWFSVLAQANSPLLEWVGSITAAVPGYGALALAQAYKESSLAKNAPSGTNNPLGLLDYTGLKPVKLVNGLPFRVFPTWTDAFTEFRFRLADLSYKVGVYGPQDLSLEGFIHIYVGGPGCWASRGATCANRETSASVRLYLEQTIQRINQWRALGEPGPIHPSPDPETPVGELLAANAKTFVGRGYCSPGTFEGNGCGDCSGLVYRVVKNVTGAELSPDSHVQATLGRSVPVDQIRAGDIICYDTMQGQEIRHGNEISHVALAVSATRAVSAMNVNQGVIEHDILSDYFAPLYRGTRRLDLDAVPIPKDPHAGLIKHAATGAPNGLWFPPDIRFQVYLTPRGPNRLGIPMTPNGTLYHQTGNTRVGADAVDHAQWQYNGTQGHPDGKVGVHFYAENDLVVLCIPPNERGIHAGDARNRDKIAVEECINADRNVEQTERTTAYVHATLLRDVIRPATTATKAMYPHTTTGCPITINRSGRWSEVERRVDALIGGDVPITLPPTYPKPSPLPFPWTGSDVAYNDSTFIALRRTFRAAQAGVKVRQWATESAPEIRAPLSANEEVKIEWIVRAADGQWWAVSAFGSRIRCADLMPAWKFEQLMEDA